MEVLCKLYVQFKFEVMSFWAVRCKRMSLTCFWQFKSIRVWISTGSICFLSLKLVLSPQVCRDYGIIVNHNKSRFGHTTTHDTHKKCQIFSCKSAPFFPQLASFCVSRFSRLEYLPCTSIPKFSGGEGASQPGGIKLENSS